VAASLLLVGWLHRQIGPAAPTSPTMGDRRHTMNAKNIHRAPKPQVFGEMGSFGEAMIQSLGRQCGHEIAKMKRSPGFSIKDALEVADRADSMTAAVLVSLLPTPDQAAALDITNAVLSVDLLPVVLNDHRIQEALHVS